MYRSGKVDGVWEAMLFLPTEQNRKCCFYSTLSSPSPVQDLEFLPSPEAGFGLLPTA